MKKYFKYKKMIFFSLLAVICITIFCNWYVVRRTASLTSNRVEDMPNGSTALVLGTGKLLTNGMPNPYFWYRIEAAVQLYKAQKIKYLILSGDNHIGTYNEPQDMKDALVSKGVLPSAIFLDYAGFRTLDSVVRSNKVFGQNNLIIISQKFHNERAIYIAQHLGLQAHGFNAKDVVGDLGMKTKAREWLARVKLFIDLYVTYAKPKFLGDRIEMPS
jgi:SanA protein